MNKIRKLSNEEKRNIQINKLILLMHYARRRRRRRRRGRGRRRRRRRRG
jgi:hypothetical protein